MIIFVKLVMIDGAACISNLEGSASNSQLFVDLSAAFDTVDHGVLKEVLNKKFGVGGAVLNWFCDYLTDWKFRVNIGSEYSRDMDLKFSVLQGSCAGPALYLAYASTPQEAVSDAIDLYGFADDHGLKNKFHPET